jgi:hypothetical protein
MDRPTRLSAAGNGRHDLAKSMYAIPTWTRTVRLVREHTGLQVVLGCENGCPSEWACYRFTAKLRTHDTALAACLDAVTAALRVLHPSMGQNIAIDGSDLPAYAKGQQYTSKNGRERAASEYSDPTPRGGTAPPSARARAAGTTATRFTPPYASSPVSRSRGQLRPRAPLRPRSR